MLIVGSQALKTHIDIGREPADTDFIATFEQVKAWMSKQDKENIILSQPHSKGKYWHVRTKDGHNYEFELATRDNTAGKILKEYRLTDANCEPREAILEDLYAIKMAHRYKRNSPHFLKTRKDIMAMRKRMLELRINPVDCLDIYPGFRVEREKESYDYAHPKLNVSKEQFFSGDGVNYVYDHDSIHLTQAIHKQWYDGGEGDPVPAYTFYMEDGAQVNTSSAKFFQVPDHVRLYGVYEESCVLALERSQIPSNFEADPQKSFLMALEKVCTSITSGWFREYAWENYDKVLDLYHQLGQDDYIERFKANAHLLKPFKEGM